MIRAATIARWFVTLLAQAASAGCRAPTPPATVPAAPTADVSGTMAAQVQATVQVLGGPRGGAAATPAPIGPTTQDGPVVPIVNLPIVLDEDFAVPPQGWLDDADSVAWHADGVYHLAARERGRFIALGAPLTGRPLGDALVSVTFREIGGPPGGGFGVIVHDQNTDSRDGAAQGGRFIVAEIGDDGTIGIWRREEDHWVDLVPWTPSTVVRAREALNELTVQTLGADITLLANGTQVAHAAMGLGKGRVGVFIGGDSNRVVLERLTVRADSAPRVAEATPTAAVIIPPPISTPRVIPPTSAPASQPSGVRTPEHDLAIIQYGPVDANSPQVREMATLLDGLSALCPENRVKFADLVAGTQKAMADRGVRESPTSILAAVRESIGTRRILATCQDYFVGHGLIQTSR